DPMTGEFISLPDIESSRLIIERTQNPKKPPPPSGLVFGHTFTDHMLTIPWNASSGWGAPKIPRTMAQDRTPLQAALPQALRPRSRLRGPRLQRGRVPWSLTWHVPCTGYSQRERLEPRYPL
ncbi:hypothetical protein CERSUDRAFT_59646, partial [Gelatoporia subvermispora B]